MSLRLYPRVHANRSTVANSESRSEPETLDKKRRNAERYNTFYRTSNDKTRDFYLGYLAQKPR